MCRGARVKEVAKKKKKKKGVKTKGREEDIKHSLGKHEGEIGGPHQLGQKSYFERPNFMV